MKIGILVYGSLDTVSGGYYYDRRLVAALRERSHVVQIISIPLRSYATALIDNFSFRFPGGLDLLIEDELCHASLLRANRSQNGTPIIGLVHHLRSCEDHPQWKKIFFRFFERAYLRSVDGFIFVSETTRRDVQALVGDRKPNVLANPPCDRFGSRFPKAMVAERALQPGPLRVLFLGNVIPRKGLHTLLAAMAHLPVNSILLDVVGSLDADPVYARKIQKQCSPLGLCGSIRFHGTLEGKPLEERFETAQILVVPSSYEGFGIVYLEGMGLGLPAIGTTSGAACEIITSGENGYLIPPGDTLALAKHLGDLLTGRDHLRVLAQNALESYQLIQPWNATADRINDFLIGMAA